jgi:hypothetical protein
MANPNPPPYWEGCGIYGESLTPSVVPDDPNDPHAFIAVGDIIRSTSTFTHRDLKVREVSGAEWWPGASDHPDDPDRGPPPDNVDPPDADRFTFCARLHCPAGADHWKHYAFMSSIHELGHLIGGIRGDSEQCDISEGPPKIRKPPEAQSVMDYECQRLEYGSDGHGARWFSRDEICFIRKGGQLCEPS